MAELEPLLASLAAARQQARTPATGRRRTFHPALDDEALGRILAPVDEALGHARLLHERLTDQVERRTRVALVR
jgi:hypothetical protein